MCELFGVSSGRPMFLNDYLREFYGHSDRHPNGWGLAVLQGKEAFIEKEPVRADQSSYLRERLSVPVREKVVLAHIRYATIGNVEYRNCHPFTGKDCSGRRWTLVHNGTIFEYEPMNRMADIQSGDTDSERILLFILDRMNREIRQKGTLESAERFRILNLMICDMAPGNKLNLLFYDGELLYVHTNYKNSLHRMVGEKQVIISTQPIGRGTWESVPMNTLQAWRDGELVFSGTNHGAEYIDSKENMKYLYQIFAEL